ncbi:hypothetical protein LTR35_017965 [Friedmanniomyces endolithicus]|nr:hypothetical protein LTR35_017965 [Friedmanniomyces endolithicus]KAK0264649.1 hypothetical protein LTS00_018023 [Friedmanniomyces endolithicus]KAK0968530.1 hypothetical protein LTR54_018196 [Friedmanniomyces endolithicus]
MRPEVEDRKDVEGADNMSSSLYQIINNNSPGWVFYLFIPVVLVIYLVFETVSKRSRNYPTEWSRKYGDFFAFTMASTAVVVLSSPDVLNDLIVKKGQKYSSRPLPSPQAALITQNARIVNMPYGTQFRAVTHRQMSFETL